MHGDSIVEVQFYQSFPLILIKLLLVLVLCGGSCSCRRSIAVLVSSS